MKSKNWRIAIIRKKISDIPVEYWIYFIVAFIFGFYGIRIYWDLNYLDLKLDDVLTFISSLFLILFAYQTKRLAEEKNRPILIGDMREDNNVYLQNSGNIPAFSVGASFVNKITNEPYNKYFQVIYPIQWLLQRSDATFLDLWTRIDLPANWFVGEYDIDMDVKYYDGPRRGKKYRYRVGFFRQIFKITGDIKR